MSATYDDIRATFPILAISSDRQIQALLCTQFCVTGENFTYAEHVADAVISHIAQEPYSALPMRSQHRRATVDAFLTFVDPTTAPRYLRALAAACDSDTSAGIFRRRLVILATQRGLAVPETFATAHIPDRSPMLSLRLPQAVADQLKSIATAHGFPSRSALVRQLIYDFTEGAQKCLMPSLEASSPDSQSLD